MKDYKTAIEQEIRLFFDRKIKQAEKISGESVELVETAKRYVLAGGKRIRPQLVILGYNTIRSGKEKEIVKASVASELLHSFLLIHDDIMDLSEKRHNEPTIHAKYRDNYDFLFSKKTESKKIKTTSKSSSKASHFGKSIAICMGDMLYSYAIEILADSEFNPAFKEKAIKWVSHILTNTCFGQMHDIFAGEKDYSAVGKKEIEIIHKLKTAKYTLEGPLVLGAILANASQREILELSKIAIPTGMAFQLQDDMLGLFADKKTLGKNIEDDIKEKKKTMLILKAMENGEAEKLLKILNKKRITEQDIESVKKIVVETSSLDYTKLLIGNLIGQSKAMLKKAKIRQAAKKELIALMDNILKRSS